MCVILIIACRARAQHCLPYLERKAHSNGCFLNAAMSRVFSLSRPLKKNYSFCCHPERTRVRPSIGPAQLQCRQMEMQPEERPPQRPQSLFLWSSVSPMTNATENFIRTDHFFPAHGKSSHNKPSWFSISVFIDASAIRKPLWRFLIRSRGLIFGIVVLTCENCPDENKVFPMPGPFSEQRCWMSPASCWEGWATVCHVCQLKCHPCTVWSELKFRSFLQNTSVSRC